MAGRKDMITWLRKAGASDVREYGRDTCRFLESAGLLAEADREVNHFRDVAKKMQTYIFLTTYDHEKAYAEAGLTEEDLQMLGRIGEKRCGKLK